MYGKSLVISKDRLRKSMKPFEIPRGNHEGQILTEISNLSNLEICANILILVSKAIP
jgi:hypothetical protein